MMTTFVCVCVCVCQVIPREGEKQKYQVNKKTYTARTQQSTSRTHGSRYVAVATTARNFPNTFADESLNAANANPNGNIPCGELQ